MSVKTKKSDQSAMSVLDGATINLLKLNFKNAQVRAIVLSKTGQSIPQELDTFDKVQVWLESVPSLCPAAVVTSAKRGTANVSFDVQLTVLETGRCSYHVECTGRGPVTISRDTIIDLASDADDFEDLQGRFYSMVSEQARQQVETKLPDASGYSDHDPDEEEGEELACRYDRAAAWNAFLSALRVIDPEEYERLEG